MSGESYLIGWLIYMAALLGFLALGWWVSRRWPGWLREPARAVVAVALIVPWTVDPDSSQWAPAWVVAIFDGALQQGVDISRAGGPLLLAVVIAAGLGVLERWRLNRKQRAGAQHE